MASVAIKDSQLMSILSAGIKTVPTFNSDQPESYFKQFERQCGTADLYKILNGTAPRLSVAGGANIIDVNNWNAKNKIIYQLLSTSLQACSTAACDKIDKAPIWDGKEAWDLLYREYNSKTPLSKMLSTTTLFRCKMEDTENVQTFATRFEKAFQKLISLGVTMEDIMCCLFVCSLSRKFAPFEVSVMLQEKIEFPKTVTDARSFEDRLKARELDSEEKAVANVASASAMVAGQKGGGGDGGVYLSKDEYDKLQARNKQKLYHDQSKNPNTPTKFERNLNCRQCGKFGHAQRTCPKNREGEQSSSSEESTPPIKSKKSSKKERAHVAQHERIVDGEESSGEERILAAWRHPSNADRSRNDRVQSKVHAFMARTIEKGVTFGSKNELVYAAQSVDEELQIRFKMTLMQARIDELEEQLETREETWNSAWDANEKAWRTNEAQWKAKVAAHGLTATIPKGRRQRRTQLRVFKDQDQDDGFRPGVVEAH
jgi:hypothetical protein